MTSALGQPLHFDINKYLDCVEGQINADEVERALWMLDNPPAFYRLNPPPRLLKIKKRLHKQLFTPIQYKEVLGEKPPEYSADMQMPSRGEMVDEFVKNLNEKNVRVTISELAPGELWLSGIMKARGRDFNYEYMALNSQETFTKDYALDAHNIFVCFELIEHLHNPFEIYQNYLKFDRVADTIFLSTPYCTFAGGLDKWETRELGHLRAYTPGEFHDCAKKMFEGYSWELMHDSVMTLVGHRHVGAPIGKLITHRDEGYGL